MNIEDLKAMLPAVPGDMVGVASLARYRERYPEAGFRLSSSLPWAIVFGIPVMRPVVETLEGRPSALYYSHYRQLNHWLDKQALELSMALAGLGHSALPMPASQTLDSQDLVAHLSHRHLGYLAGLGWHGRNNLLVHPRVGSAWRLVTVLTDAPLVEGEPMADMCGSCRACIDQCPASAIGESVESFSLEACHKKLSEFRGIPRLGQRICGVCIKACRGGRTI